MRTFTDAPAKRQAVRLLIGIYGPSGGGKTLSALRLAAGIRRVAGGEVYVIDTEEGRALHYAQTNATPGSASDFRHVPFRAPFGPLDYLAAFEHCVSRGARTVVVDSMSHEHEGPGGVLDQHDSVVSEKGESHSMRAWVKPKRDRTRLINTLVQMPCNVILCFRAREKVRPQKRGEAVPDGMKKGEPISLGWQPIGGPEFAYEMTCRMLLKPGANGVPEWHTHNDRERDDIAAERLMIKRPRYFEKILADGVQLSEEVGEAMARWAAGGLPASPSPTEPPREPGAEVSR